MAEISATQWQELNPLLDELLEAAEPRAHRLAQIRRANEALANHLEALLRQRTAVERDAFLEGVALALPKDDTLAGMVVGSYTLERPIGQGGMGQRLARAPQRRALRRPGGDQVPEPGAAGPRRRRALPARRQRAGAPRASERGAAHRCRRGRRQPAVPRARVRRRPTDRPLVHGSASSASRRACGCSATCSARSRTRTASSCCIATSSPRTSSSPGRARQAARLRHRRS